MSGLQGTAVGWAMRTGAADALARAGARRSLLDKLAAAAFIAVFVVVSIYSWVRPDYNWDMVAYVATALENRTDSPEQLHAETWAAISEGARLPHAFQPGAFLRVPAGGVSIVGNNHHSGRPY